MKERIKVLVSNLKDVPGVYLMKDEEGNIIYVGKAKNLKKRVSQYFLRPQSGKVAKMVFTVDSFETIITNSEKEALILEMNLIQKYYPRFNILLKDDKHYPYIALKRSGDPFLSIKRHSKDKKYIYFGPFPNSSAAYQTLNLLNNIFPLRKCKNIPSTPCLYYHLGQCLAPCVNKVSDTTYQDLVREISSFLNGDNSSKRREYVEKMNKASDEMKYENASEYKKIIDAIDHINTKQVMEINEKIDRDFFAYSLRDGYLSLALLSFKKGVLLGKEVFVVEEFGDINELIASLIYQYYESHSLPHEVIVSLEEIKNELSLLDTKVIVPKKGKLFELVALANKNATEGLDEHFLTARLDDDKLEILEMLGDKLHIKTPYRIELFDNSHIQGASPVGAMVVFINGEPCKKMYRRFHIEHQEARDDLQSMKEIIYRRYKRLQEENQSMPDMIIVDGGKTQIDAAKDVLDSLELDIPLFGLFKDNHHRTRGLMSQSDECFYFDDNKKLFFLLVRLQDEVHRFAISFHHELRNKSLLSSPLDDIKGLGKKRREVIEEHFKTIEDLKSSSEQELSQFVPFDVARRIKEKLK